MKFKPEEALEYVREFIQVLPTKDLERVSFNVHVELRERDDRRRKEAQRTKQTII